MFDHAQSVIGLLPGERPEDFEADVDVSYEVTCRELADGWAEPARGNLPSGFEAIPTGPYLAAIVSALGPSHLDGHDAVRLMKAQARLASHHEAGKYMAMAEVAYAPPSDPDSGVLRLSEEVEYAAVEIAAALTLTRRTSETELGRAVSLAGRLRRVREAYSAGDLDTAKTKVFHQALGHLPDETVDRVLDEVLDEAADMTTGQLRAALSRLVLTLDPEGSASSFEEGVADRGVVTYPNPDLTGTLAIHNADPAAIRAGSTSWSRWTR